MRVAEALLIRVIPRLVKIVHVELADERRKVVVLEKPRQYPLSELVRLLHDEAVARLAPADDRI